MTPKKSTITDVAKLAGVSKMTVSRFINGSGKVAAETKINIEAAIKKLDFHPSSVARRLNGLANRSIAVIASRGAILDSEKSITYFSEMIRMLISLGQQQRFAIIVTASDLIINNKPDYIKMIEEKSVCGVVMLDLVENDPRLAEIEKRGVPTVVLGAPLHQRKNVYCVSNTDKEGGFMATEHLIECGAQKIAFLGAPHALRSSALRLEGFRLALAKHQLKPYESLILLNERFGKESTESGYKGMKELLRKKVRPDAVFCTSDLRAIGAMRAIQEAKLRIPHDIRLMGYDNLFISEFAPIPLTTMAQPMHSMAKQAIEILENCVENHEIAQKSVFLKPTLIQRQTT